MNKMLPILACLIASVAFAQGPEAVPAPAPDSAPAVQPAKPAPGRPPRAPHLSAQMPMEPLVQAVIQPEVAAKLGLTEDQVARLKALPEFNRDLQKKARQAMEHENRLLEATPIDEAAVMTAIDQVWEARKEVAKAQTKRLIAIRSILTPEQIQQALGELRARRGKGAPRPPKGEKRPHQPKPDAPAPKGPDVE